MQPLLSVIGSYPLRGEKTLDLWGEDRFTQSLAILDVSLSIIHDRREGVDIEHQFGLFAGSGCDAGLLGLRDDSPGMSDLS